jgi:hypothetical protein
MEDRKDFWIGYLQGFLSTQNIGADEIGRRVHDKGEYL